MGQTVNKILIAMVTVYCGYWLAGALRNDYFWGSRRYGHHKIFREKQPRLYWFNVAAMAVFLLLGLLFLAWRLFPRNTSR